MPIVVNLDVMMARRHKGAGELAEEIGITPANLSILKNNKAKAVRFSTLEALCRALDCQPGDILEFVPDGLYAAVLTACSNGELTTTQAAEQLAEGITAMLDRTVAE